MKKTIVVFLALVLAGPFVIWADPQDGLKGKVVRISGAVNGLGVVLLYKAGICIILEEVDGYQRQAFDLKNKDCRLAVLADSREAYVQMQADGLTLVEIAARAKLAPALSAFAYLSDIAENARKGRIGTAIPSLIAGGVVSTYGILFLTTDDVLGLLTLASGLFTLGVGAIHLSQKTSAERSYDQAQKLSDEERNAFCADALKEESKQAQTGRYIKSGLCIGLAAVALNVIINNFNYKYLSSEDMPGFLFIISPVIGLGFSALYNIAFPSYEEKMYRRYLKGKAAVEQSKKLVWNVGLVPRGFALGVRYYF
jgi:cadmium resistance protein CadD (predicted permease)